ncbi:uncharacterized protein LOC108665551 [Hyalella azteca]|uniref:Uncharacterized protein LOC108665551 n=1 Tax=Hyalella azteca TaxID=294128 RepID=A0A979FJJ8_HYAAZ|nr:uncharacterized protein LOC108665551 [Hyalella azteca]
MVKKTSFQPVKPLDSPKYADLDDISRCVHFDDFEAAARTKMLVPQPLTNSHVRLRQRVLWFAPSHPSYRHNFYGNVSFTIKWETVNQKLGPNLYLIDQAIYNARSFTRVVFTRNNYDRILKKVDLESDDSPMTKSWTGFRHASHCMNKVSWGPHELQIAIEVNYSDIKWLYLNSKAVANNHSLANTASHKRHTRKDGKEAKFESYKCFKFNTAQNIECPYQWTERVCQEQINAEIRTTVLTSSCSGTSLLFEDAPPNPVCGSEVYSGNKPKKRNKKVLSAVSTNSRSDIGLVLHALPYNHVCGLSYPSVDEFENQIRNGLDIAALTISSSDVGPKSDVASQNCVCGLSVSRYDKEKQEAMKSAVRTSSCSPSMRQVSEAVHQNHICGLPVIKKEKREKRIKMGATSSLFSIRSVPDSALQNHVCGLSVSTVDSSGELIKKLGTALPPSNLFAKDLGSDTKPQNQVHGLPVSSLNKNEEQIKMLEAAVPQGNLLVSALDKIDERMKMLKAAVPTSSLSDMGVVSDGTSKNFARDFSVSTMDGSKYQIKILDAAMPPSSLSDMRLVSDSTPKNCVLDISVSTVDGDEDQIKILDAAMPPSSLTDMGLVSDATSKNGARDFSVSPADGGHERIKILEIAVPPSCLSSEKLVSDVALQNYVCCPWASTVDSGEEQSNYGCFYSSQIVSNSVMPSFHDKNEKNYFQCRPGSARVIREEKCKYALKASVQPSSSNTGIVSDIDHQNNVPGHSVSTVNRSCEEEIEKAKTSTAPVSSYSFVQTVSSSVPHNFICDISDFALDDLRKQNKEMRKSIIISRHRSSMESVADAVLLKQIRDLSVSAEDESEWTDVLRNRSSGPCLRLVSNATPQSNSCGYACATVEDCEEQNKGLETDIQTSSSCSDQLAANTVKQNNGFFVADLTVDERKEQINVVLMTEVPTSSCTDKRLVTNEEPLNNIFALSVSTADESEKQFDKTLNATVPPSSLIGTELVSNSEPKKLFHGHSVSTVDELAEQPEKMPISILPTSGTAYLPLVSNAVPQNNADFCTEFAVPCSEKQNKNVLKETVPTSSSSYTGLTTDAATQNNVSGLCDSTVDDREEKIKKILKTGVSKSSKNYMRISPEAAIQKYASTRTVSIADNNAKQTTRKDMKACGMVPVSDAQCYSCSLPVTSLDDHIKQKKMAWETDGPPSRSSCKLAPRNPAPQNFVYGVSVSTEDDCKEQINVVVETAVPPSGLSIKGPASDAESQNDVPAVFVSTSSECEVRTVTAMRNIPTSSSTGMPPVPDVALQNYACGPTLSTASTSEKQFEMVNTEGATSCIYSFGPVFGADRQNNERGPSVPTVHECEEQLEKSLTSTVATSSNSSPSSIEFETSMRIDKTIPPQTENYPRHIATVHRPAISQNSPRSISRSTKYDRKSQRRLAPRPPVTAQPSIMSDNKNYNSNIHYNSNFSFEASTDHSNAWRHTTPVLKNENRSRYQRFLDIICCRKQQKDNMNTPN